MEKIANTVYKTFGLSVSSELPLPELPVMNKHIKVPDLTVKYGDLTRGWEAESMKGNHFVIHPDYILFIVPETAIFMVRNGKEITISPFREARNDYLRLFLLGTCMGAILLQRRILPLHGSAIAINGKAYAIVGDSGAGKSTLASAFLNRGYKLLSDDVIPVSLNEEGYPVVTPAYPQQKLWQESLTAFGMDSNQLRPIIDRETKFAVPVPDRFASEPLPLAGVYELVKTEAKEVALEPVDHLERFHKLFYHTYRNFIVRPSGLLEWHFQMCASIVKKIDFYQIRRPVSSFTAQELSSRILSAINEEVAI
ncbi:aldolase [Salipaludibacillus sp. CUR1]|uniref:aldolase n=1 Tax=Salipaludibacillus sp. CUR1 TaxID=2820003 RepID=UPI001E3DE9B4|nr:aldolase [Salipaludibacillus sp. CUR1]MCE7792759.1 aldolase [Salipaludibacillus sp. CUR1]